jgi:hypothetical protein
MQFATPQIRAGQSFWLEKVAHMVRNSKLKREKIPHRAACGVYDVGVSGDNIAKLYTHQWRNWSLPECSLLLEPERTLSF